MKNRIPRCRTEQYFLLCVRLTERDFLYCVRDVWSIWWVWNKNLNSSFVFRGKAATRSAPIVRFWVRGTLQPVSEQASTLHLPKQSEIMFRSGGEFLSVIEWSSVRQGTQHFTNENKVSRKWSDSVHLLPLKLNKNKTTTHRVLIVKIQKQKSIKLSYNIYYKTRSQLYIRPTINQ